MSEGDLFASIWSPLSQMGRLSAFSAVFPLYYSRYSSVSFFNPRARFGFTLLASQTAATRNLQALQRQRRSSRRPITMIA
jgi:hypothetical protein